MVQRLLVTLSSQMMRCPFVLRTAHRLRQINTMWFFTEMPRALLDRVSKLWRGLFGPTLPTVGSRSVSIGRRKTGGMGLFGGLRGGVR